MKSRLSYSYSSRNLIKSICKTLTWAMSWLLVSTSLLVLLGLLYFKWVIRRTLLTDTLSWLYSSVLRFLSSSIFNCISSTFFLKYDKVVSYDFTVEVWVFNSSFIVTISVSFKAAWVSRNSTCSSRFCFSSRRLGTTLVWHSCNSFSFFANVSLTCKVNYWACCFSFTLASKSFSSYWH